MILKVFSLLDIKAGMYTQPFMFPSTGQAVRAVQDLAADLNTTVGRHPGDFALYQIATWNDATGRYEDMPHAHIAGVDTLAPVVRNNDLLTSLGNN